MNGLVCVSVCQFVCLSHLRYLEREVILPYCLHHLEELHLASCTNCFQAYMTNGSREKAFGILRQLLTEFRARTVTFLVTPGRVNPAHYNKAIGTFSKGTH